MEGVSKPTATKTEYEMLIPLRPKLDETKTMKAIVWEGKSKVRCTERPFPCITHPKDVLLKVTATSISGSDMHLYTNALPNLRSGEILGQEFMGIIQEVGTEVKKLKLGQRVVVAYEIACGECDFCKRQEFTACSVMRRSRQMEERTTPTSFSHLTCGVSGGQAQFVRVPLADVNCLLVPDNVPDEKALYLSNIIPTAFHATELADVREGDTVAIWGLGSVGLLTAEWCQLRKAKRIIGIDRVPERIQTASSKLGIEVINYKDQNVVDTLLELVPGGVDCAIECVGFDYVKSFTHKVEMALNLESDSCEILSEMIKTTRRYGRMSVIGIYTGKTNHFPIGTLMDKNLTLRGGHCPVQKYWPICLEKMTKNQFDPSFVLTHRGKLMDAPDFYDKLSKRSEGIIKVFLDPRD